MSSPVRVENTTAAWSVIGEDMFVILAALAVYSLLLGKEIYTDYTTKNTLSSEFDISDFHCPIELFPIKENSIPPLHDEVNCPFNFHTLEHNALMAELDNMIDNCAILLGKLDTEEVMMNMLATVKQ